MLKIYPSPFNKLAFFILYGLLSVAAITLAQSQTPSIAFPQTTATTNNGGNGGNGGDGGDKCTSPLSPGQLTFIGYIPQPKSIDLTTIRWDYYDFINVIAYTDPSTTLSLIHPPADLSSLDAIVNASKPSTKILLSIRNFDPSLWPTDPTGYRAIVNETIGVITQHNLDGVDIEYPGMRGRVCGLWDPENDQSFVDFIKILHGRTKQLGKTLMLTVGDNSAVNFDANNIDILNVETFHNSFYVNYPLPPGNSRVRTSPNFLSDYKSVYDSWDDKIDKKRIVMGVDLGNTLQVVDNQDILSNQTVTTGIRQINPGGEYNDLSQIRFCPTNNELSLYPFPWKRLIGDGILSDDGCYGINFGNGWQNHSDSNSSPWLTKDTPGPDSSLIYYVSYEDFTSLNSKLTFATNSVGGISISDISYDTDSPASLISYMQVVRGKQGQSTNPGPGDPTAGSSSSNSPTNTTIPTNNDITQGDGKDKGKIIGAVVGSVFGLIIISGILFVGYRHRDKLPFGQNQYEKNMMMYNTHGTHNPGMIPEGSPRMIIPETTAVPVAPSYVTAMFDFAGKEENDLSFKKGDKIEVLERGDGPNDWWVGRVNGAVGEFPGNYVKE